MFPMRRIIRLNFPQTSLSVQSKKLSTTFPCLSKKDDSSSDDEKSDKKSHKTQTDAVKRLNLLLKTMVDEKDTLSTKAVNIELARPKQRELKKREIAKAANDPKVILNAAKQVAVNLGGNVKQTETELLTKLGSPVSKADLGKEFIPRDDSRVPGNEYAPNKITPTKPTISLNELIVGMKIDRSKRPGPTEGRAAQVRRMMKTDPSEESRPWKDKRREDRYGNMEELRSRSSPIKVDLFGSEPLGIFHPKKSQDQTGSHVTTYQVDYLPTWQALHKRELRLAVTHPPSNYFEEMILWTEAGKLWKFPIDNEQGLDEERKVYFTEHVFLERFLEPWCPKKGPVRHFMELVCVGLSKNPYVTAKEKRDHIDWFRDYFQKKLDILKETGAVDDSSAEKLSITA